MATMSNQDVVRTLIEEGFNKGNLDAVDVLVAADCIEHQFGLGPGAEGTKQAIRALRRGFPDFHLDIVDIVEQDNKVWIRMVSHGTNLGPFMGPPTGKETSITVFDVARVAGGKIVEHWGSPDRFALMAQLGVLPRLDTKAALAEA